MMVMSGPAEQSERLMEILREVIALSKRAENSDEANQSIDLPGREEREQLKASDCRSDGQSQ
jgi:hypothetical protein